MSRLGPVAVVCLFAVTVGSPSTAQPPKEDDRLKQLEKRVADLEKEVADLRSQLKLLPKPALDNKLVGSWGAKDKEAELTGLRLELDGTCSLSESGSGQNPAVWKGKYEVVGKTVAMGKMTSPTRNGTGNFTAEVVSVDEKALVVRWGKMEIRLERQ